MLKFEHIAGYSAKYDMGSVTMKCSSCGKEIQSDFKMCPYCGAAVETEQETAFISLPVEAYDEPDEEVYEESYLRGLVSAVILCFLQIP